MLAMCVYGFVPFFLDQSSSRFINFINLFKESAFDFSLFSIFLISALFPSTKIYFFQLKVETLFYAFLFFKYKV